MEKLRTRRVTLDLTVEEYAAVQDLVALQKELYARLIPERRERGGSFPEVEWTESKVLRAGLRDFARVWKAEAAAEGYADLVERYHRLPDAFAFD